MPIDDSANFTISVTPPFGTGKALIAYTYRSQMTNEKVDLLLQHHSNMFIVDGTVDNNTDYTNYPEHVSTYALQYAVMAKQKGFYLFGDLHWTHAHFNPNNSKVPGGFPVVYSNGDVGHQISPFCQGYWQWMTDLVKNMALLSINHPDLYRFDGVNFDFELYGHDEGHSGYFNAEWGFEDWTFNQYCVSRQITNPNLPAAERFNWLVQQGRIILDSKGNHTGDYYVFLSGLIRGYAQNMRQQVHAVNPKFVIGAYPSPEWHWYYGAEIQSGWSTSTKPSIIIGTEPYYTGGASKIPAGLNNLKQPGGFYNLTTIYPSHISANNPIYAYYIPGIVIMQDSTYYFSNDYAYNTYNLVKGTNGYFIFTTYSLTEPFETLTPIYRVWCYDAATNSIIQCADATMYAEEVQKYYNQMEIMHTELQKYMLDPNYVSPLAPTTPPPIVYQMPPLITFPSLNPIQTPTYQPLTYGYQPKLRGLHYLVLFAQAGQNVQFTIKYADVSTTHCGLQYLVTDNNTNIVTQGYMNYLNNQKTVTFTAPATGCYLLSIHPTANGCFYIMNTNIPMTIFKQNDVHTISSVISGKYNLFFWVDAESTVSLTFTGQGTAEGAAVSIYKPEPTGGYTLFASQTTTPSQNTITFDLQIPVDAQQKIWKMEITKPANQILEDVWITSPQKNLFYYTDDPRYCLK